MFKDAGYEIVAATPGGVPPTVDALSLTADFNGGPEGAQRMQEAVRDATELAHPIRLEDVRLEDYAAVFVPGGWGPMEDLSVDAEVGRLMTERLASGQPLALVCHGPAALLTSVGNDGTSPFAGYRLTSLSNAEERQSGFAERAKWLLEDRLVELGVEYRGGEPWAPHIEVDRSLYTGQNPASAVPLAHEVLNALRAAESDSSNVALVRRMYDSKGDPAVTREIMAPDIVWDVTPGFPLGGVYDGYDSMANDFFGRLLQRFDSFYAEGEQFYADDDNHVLVLGHYHGTAKNGTRTAARFIHLWTIRDGKLAHMQQAADSLVVERALNP